MSRIYLATPLRASPNPGAKSLSAGAAGPSKSHSTIKTCAVPPSNSKHHTGHRYRTFGPILNFANVMPDMKASPALGEHNHEILKEAGLTEEEISAVVG